MGLMNPAIAAIFAVIFIILWRRRPQDKSVLAFGIAHFFIAGGFLVHHLSPQPDAAASALLMHAVYCSSTALVCWAAAERMGQSLNMMAIAVIGIVAGAMMYFASFSADMNPRLIAANTAYGLMFALAAQIVSRAEMRSLVDHAILWLLAITSAQFFIRPMVAVILGGPMSAEAYRSSEHYAVLMLFMGIDSLLLALALVAAAVLDQWRSASEEAELDSLSGLKMRRSFESAAMKMLDENLDRALPVCMIVGDLDHFKRVNDIWGHQAGDEAIAAFGTLVSQTVRATDLCGRIGGEEFCIMVYNCEEGPAAGLADRIRRKFGSLEMKALGPDIRLTASFGVTQWRPGEGYGKLFARADAALYAAKNAGRDCVVSSDNAHSRTPSIETETPKTLGAKGAEQAA